jgi:hypothetical protein
MLLGPSSLADASRTSAESLEVRETLRDESVELQRMATDYAHAHDIPPANVHVADETGMWSGYVPLRTRVDPAMMGAGVLREGDKRRDTEMVALSARGTVDAEFLPHQPQVTRRAGDQTLIVQKGISGMGTSQMKS